MVDALAPGMTGKWMVHTEFSNHLFDLDLHLYRRQQIDRAFNELRKDDLPLVLEPTHIIFWPEVGKEFTIVISVAGNSDVATVRTSSIVRSIEQVGGEQP